MVAFTIQGCILLIEPLLTVTYGVMSTGLDYTKFKQIFTLHTETCFSLAFVI